MYNTILRHGGANNESYTAHSGTIMKVTLPTQSQTKLQGGGGGGGE